MFVAFVTKIIEAAQHNSSDELYLKPWSQPAVYLSAAGLRRIR